MPENLLHSISYQPASAAVATASRITLEPEYVDTRAGLADLGDVAAMVNIARSGASAVTRQLDRCPWAKWRTDDALELTLKLWVWPSDPQLPYQLDLPDGVTSKPRQIVQVPRRRRFWFSGGKVCDLPWRLSAPRLSWLENIGTHDQESRSVPAPTLSLQGLQVISSAPVYGVLEASGTAEGYLHELVIVYPRHDAAGNPVKITANDFEVVCRWTDAAGEAQETACTMRIPPGVADLLAECPDGEPITTVRVGSGSRNPVIVYYNTCNGKVLGYGKAKKE